MNKGITVENKENKEKSKQKEISKGKLMIFLGLLPSVIMILIGMLLVIVAIIQKESVIQSNIASIAFKIAETDIIGTAVTIWVGLNIYNLTTKEELKEKIDEGIQNHLKSVEERYNEVLENEIDKNAFIKQLEKSRYQYAISDYLLRYIEKTDAENFDGINYKTAQTIEKYWILAAQFYERNQWKASMKYAEKLFDIMEHLEMDNLGAVGQIYKWDRRGDSYFYLNCAKGRIEKEANTNELESAIEDFKKEYELLKKVGAEKMTISYILNAIGYTYRLLCREMDIREQINEWCEANSQVIEYGELSIKADHSKGRYIRNTGIGYELLYFNFEQICHEKGCLEVCKECFDILRKSYYNKNVERGRKIETCITKNIEEYDIDEIKKIIRNKLKDVTESYYLTAAKMDKEDYKGFNNIGAFYLKLLDEELEVDSDRQDIICNVLNQNITEKNRDEILDRVLEAKHWLVLAKEVSGTFEDCRYNLAKAKMYEFFCIEDVAKKENIKRQALEEVKKVILMKETIEASYYVLRNCYEAFGEIDKAIEINTRLSSKGDKDKISKLYSK